MENEVRTRAHQSTNNFGALRLLFAILVILSHSPELIDGNRSRELLTRMFGTLSFGELGVDGFFLISGYLIAKSFEDSQSSGNYLIKRVLRIYPGYIVAFLLCILAIGPVVGGKPTSLTIVTIFRDIALLKPPELPGVFAGTPYPALNGSMWTIAYEFRCYLLVMALGFVGLLSKRTILVIFIGAALSLSAMHIQIPGWFPFPGWLGNPETDMRFVGIFGSGSLFYLYRNVIRYDWRLAILASSGLTALMFFPLSAEAAVAILGGYVLFWFAFNVRSPTLAGVGRNVDLSYGVYLYAWPTQKLLIWFYPGISPWLVFIETSAISSLLAFGSWRIVERPFLSLKAVFAPTLIISNQQAQ